jgi:hypothetical protein
MASRSRLNVGAKIHPGLDLEGRTVAVVLHQGANPVLSDCPVLCIERLDSPRSPQSTRASHALPTLPFFNRTGVPTAVY